MALDENNLEAEHNPDESHPMDSLLAESDFNALPSRGEIRTGTIARITDNELWVDVGAKREGIIAKRELDELDAETRESIQIGHDVTVYVVNPQNRSGNLVLSISKAREMQDWQAAMELQESQEVYHGQLAGYNKGGLIVNMGELRGFIPASQMSLARRRRSIGETPAQRWGGMVGEEIAVKVIEVDQSRNRLILSERAASKESRALLKEKLLEELEVGTTRTGRVISLADFGAFVDLGGAEGLVHLSELTWKHIDHPSEVLQVGGEVEVLILNVDHDRKRIALSLKRLEADPWEKVADTFQVGQLVEATITRLTKFGAFARLRNNEEIEGLVHISELSHGPVGHPKEIVAEGDQLTLRIIKFDPERRRMGLSLKEVDSPRYADLDYEFYVNRDAEQETAQPEAAVTESETEAVSDAPSETTPSIEAEDGEVEVAVEVSEVEEAADAEED